MTWAIDTVCLMSLSRFSAGATVCFSFAGFAGGFLTNILVAEAYATTQTPQSQAMHIIGLWILLPVIVVSLVGGIACLLSQKSITEQFKSESGPLNPARDANEIYLEGER